MYPQQSGGNLTFILLCLTEVSKVKLGWAYHSQWQQKEIAFGDANKILQYFVFQFHFLTYFPFYSKVGGAKFSLLSSKQLEILKADLGHPLLI